MYKNTSSGKGYSSQPYNTHSSSSSTYSASSASSRAASVASSSRSTYGYGSKPAVVVHNTGGTTRDPVSSGSAGNQGYWK
ncbi:hypothetical protein H2201_006646 [Coniosporium apollinis]|uniref:REJ domain-containing protein n=2 Tax=Coniosporium TaxID=2810619 RepID=A0ABQ9NSY9_9PEZI|nr:hypothetical protein H2199_003888 [Cladosporium sp. JES 115]KAJ9661096.1 hypothetical protein H2201_006646 [Coniosporium apollinis]